MEAIIQNSKVPLNVSAPSFCLNDIYGNEINLESYRGSNVLIGFFRHAGCPFCNLRVHTLMKNHEAFEAKNLKMIFFFESEARVIRNSSFLSQVSPVPIISDPQKTWYDTYGLEEAEGKVKRGVLTGFIKTAISAWRHKLPMHNATGEEALGTMPAEFLLDQHLIIRELHYSQRLTDRLSMNVIHEFLG